VHTITGGWGDQKFPLAVGHGEEKTPPASSLSSNRGQPSCTACRSEATAR
jgi:hypothetical protein